MHINTTARHCELDPEVRWFAHQRLEKLRRFARDIAEAHLIVSAEGYRHNAEITLRLRGREMVSREESTELRSAIDRAVDRLERQLRRIKERRVSRKRTARSRNDRTSPAPPSGDATEWEYEEPARGED
jgi:putative sigma-54 modulation protein